VSWWDTLKEVLGWTEEDDERRPPQEVDARMEAAEELAGFYNGRGLARTATTTPALEAYQLRPNDGVKVEPVPITRYDQVTVSYDGLLARAGAQQVILHWGYGPGPWRKVREQLMERKPDGRWETRVVLDDGGRFSFCFRDNAYNWDNNSGRNWSYEIHEGTIPW